MGAEKRKRGGEKKKKGVRRRGKKGCGAEELYFRATVSMSFSSACTHALCRLSLRLSVNKAQNRNTEILRGKSASPQ